MTSNLLKNNPLFRECIEALNIPLLSDQEDTEFLEVFENDFPLTKWGKIDWDKINQKIEVGYEQKDIIPSLEKLLGNSSFDKTVYILWDDGGLPLIKAELENVIKNFYDVTCVCTDTFMFNPVLNYVIERRHGGKITVGVLNAKYQNT